MAAGYWRNAGGMKPTGVYWLYVVCLRVCMGWCEGAYQRLSPKCKHKFGLETWMMYDDAEGGSADLALA